MYRLLSVGAHTALDTLVPKKAISALDVPQSPREITPEWLTAVLCKGLPGSRVLAVEAMGGSVGTSTRQALRLELNDEALARGVPSRLFTKCSTRFNQRMMLGLSGMIEGEIGFYPQIRPQIDIEAPRGYHVCIARRSWRSMILMEDVVASKGARFIATETRIARAQMEDLLSNMALWHGYFWNSPQLAHQLKWLRTPTEFLDAISPLGFRFLCEHGMRRAEAVIPHRVLVGGNALWSLMAASLDLDARRARTVLHGDPHIGQTYITQTGRMGYADWQLVMQGGWAFDVSYAIVSALTVDDRRAWERELLHFYLDRLEASGGPKLGFDEAWLRYRLNLIYPYFCWLMTINGNDMPLLPDMQPRQVALDIIARVANAIFDLEPIKVPNIDSRY